MTPEELAVLRERYNSDAIPRCGLCGGGLVLAVTRSGEPPKWYCASPPGQKYDRQWWDHRNRSARKEAQAGGDPSVIKLIEEYEELLSSAPIWPS